MMEKSAGSYLSATWLVIVNPHAARGRVGKCWPATREQLAAVLPNMEIVTSRRPGDAVDIISAAAARGIRHVLAVGGDGTAHQVVNGIMRQRVVPAHELTFALLPLGTGNDWIKTHGISRAWEAWIAYFKTALPARQNLGKILYKTGEGKVEERYFMNVAGLAYDAFVVRFTDGKTSRLPGKLFYLWATFRCLFQYQPQSATLRYDDRQTEQAFYTINIGIGKYSGGGMQLVPQAESQGDHFALTYVGRVSKLEVMLNSFRFYGGKIRTYGKARLTRAKHLTITPSDDNSMLIEADGEFLGHCPAEITLVEDGLCFLRPS